MQDWQAFIFDFDGVLADSVEVKTDAFARLFAPYGAEVVTQVVAHHRKHGGMSRFEKFRIYHEEFLGKEISESEISALARRFSELVMDRVVAADEIAGASEFLEKYSERIPCFINSATPTPEVETIVERRGWGKHFKEVTGSPRTKTENLRYIVGKYHLSRNGCVFFGDAMSDYEAALACCMPFLGIATSERSPLLADAAGIPCVRDLHAANQWMEAR
jgi:phosphoglycolate phosphatase-like HAD superfamily hydrolase